jgi:hypothetical protein
VNGVLKNSKINNKNVDNDDNDTDDYDVNDGDDNNDINNKNNVRYINISIYYIFRCVRTLLLRMSHFKM